MIQKGMPLEAVLILEVLKNLHPFTFDTPKLTNLVLGTGILPNDIGLFFVFLGIDNCVYSRVYRFKYGHF